MTIDNEQFVRAESGELCKEKGLFGFNISYDDSALVILGVPWELTTSYRHGTSNAPPAIVLASQQIDLYDDKLPNTYRRGIHYQLFDNPSDQLPAYKSATEHRQSINSFSERFNVNLYQKCQKIIADGKLLGLVGGEHSVPFAYLKLLAEQHQSLAILHIDAHLDYRIAYQGYEYSHASIMSQVMSKFSNIERIVHVASRDFCLAELQFANKLGKRAKIFHDRDLQHRFTANEIIDCLPDKVYISFDIDGLDPSLCPNSGTPVPGGLSFYQACSLLEELVTSGRQVVGFDLSEVGVSNNGWDENVAARILYKLCATILSTN